MSTPPGLAAPTLRPVEYTYSQSIGASQLRVLQPILTTRSFLSFKVVHASRTCAPRYTAVSYTWGDETPSQIIHLDGDTFRVRPNLWSCLYYLSSNQQPRGWSCLWVDAICINQNDDQERSAQVSKMDQTYRDATCVSVWLGLIPLSDTIHYQRSNHAPILTAESDDFCWIESMTDLANRPYWSRFWVIQEFLLNNDVVLHCSDNMIGWFSFQEILCSEAGFNQYGGQAENNLPTSLVNSFRALPLVTGRHPDKYPELMQPLQALLVRHRESVCKDPRDRIFALLGLVSYEERGLLARYFPNYKMTKEEVCIITLAHLNQCVLPGELWGTTAGLDELFQGLGIESKAEKAKMRLLARDIDYLGDFTTDQLLSIIEWNGQVQNLAGRGYGAIDTGTREADPHGSERIDYQEILISHQLLPIREYQSDYGNFENPRGGTTSNSIIGRSCIAFVAIVALAYWGLMK